MPFAVAATKNHLKKSAGAPDDIDFLKYLKNTTAIYERESPERQEIIIAIAYIGDHLDNEKAPFKAAAAYQLVADQFKFIGNEAQAARFEEMAQVRRPSIRLAKVIGSGGSKKTLEMLKKLLPPGLQTSTPGQA